MGFDQESKMECEKALSLLAAGDLLNRVGLPATCGPAALAAVWTGGETLFQGRLSSHPTPFRSYHALEREGTVRAWFDDDDFAFLITIEAPKTKPDVKTLLDRLGPPEKKLDPFVGYHADAHQWIYANRGLTLFVREHLNEMARIAAYRPNSVVFYELYLGATNKRRYKPRAK